MVNIVAFQTLEEMSTPSRAGTEQSRAVRNTGDSQPRLRLYKRFRVQKK
jgi:hypothetical protein